MMAIKRYSKSNKKKVQELQEKLEVLEERHAFGEIGRNIFEKIGAKLKLEIQNLRKEIDSDADQLSNPEKFIEYALKMCVNLPDLWVSGDCR